MALLRIPPDVTGSRKYKMAAVKSEVLISQLAPGQDSDAVSQILLNFKTYVGLNLWLVPRPQFIILFFKIIFLKILSNFQK